MQPLTRHRRDPSPSRVAYRMQRLWLTPHFRMLLRVGLPTLALALGLGWYLSDAGRIADLQGRVVALRRSLEDQPIFMVRQMLIKGASSEVSADIREIVPLDFPLSSFDLDLGAIRKTVEGLDAVADADVRLSPGGVLRISVHERQPALIWRSRDRLELLAADGRRVASLARRSARPDLPLIAGAGADRAAPEALAIFAAARPLAARLRGLVRVGQRRWDVVLDRGQRIMLPEKGAVEALDRVLALDAAQDLLARDLQAVDVRDPRRTILRLRPAAVRALRQIRGTTTGGNA